MEFEFNVTYLYMEVYTYISCTFQSLPYCFTIMFCVILLFSGLLFGTTSAQIGGYPNIGGSSPFLSSSIGSARAHSSYSPYNARKFVKGGAQIVPMPYPYPYSFGSQGVRSQPIVLSTGRQSGGFLGGAAGGGKYFMY